MKLASLFSLALGLAVAAPAFVNAQYNPREVERVEAQAVAHDANRTLARYDRNHDGHIAAYEVRRTQQAQRREWAARQHLARIHAEQRHLARSAYHERLARDEAFRARWD
jgi:hypothetical protein